MERRIDHDAIATYTQRLVFLLRKHREHEIERLPQDARDELDDLAHQMWPALDELRITLLENPPPSDPNEVHAYTLEWMAQASPDLHGAMSSRYVAEQMAEEIVARS
jgi:hypothetical protein